MNPFKVGDKVRIHRKGVLTNWISSMDRNADGKVGVVTTNRKDDYCNVHVDPAWEAKTSPGVGWLYHISCLERVDLVPQHLFDFD